MHSALFTVLSLLQILWMASPAEAGYTLIQQPAANDPMQVHIYRAGQRPAGLPDGQSGRASLLRRDHCSRRVQA